MSDEDVLDIQIPDKLFFRIGEVAELVGVEPHVLVHGAVVCEDQAMSEVPRRPARALTPALARFVSGPVAIQVGAATPDLEPRAVRAFGCRVEEEPWEVSVFVWHRQAREVLEALARNPRVTVNCVHILRLHGIQLKGVRTETFVADGDDRRLVESYIDDFVRVLGEIGRTREDSRGAWDRGRITGIKLQVEEIYDQTPGTGAGALVEGEWDRA